MVVSVVSIANESSPVIRYKSHEVGEFLALVTWKQQTDDYWFGARIPGYLESVEVVKTLAGATGNIVSYHKYDGENLVPDIDSSQMRERLKYILHQEPSVMP